MALSWVYIANLKGTTGNTGTYYIRELTSTDDIYSLAPGAYRVGADGSSNPALPLARYGDLIVNSPTGARTITFQTNDLGIVRNEIRSFIIGSDNTGSFTGKKWRELTTSARGLPANHAIDVWTKEVGYNGSFAISVSSVDAAGSKNPTDFSYNLDHETQPNGATVQQAWGSHSGDQGAYFRSETSAASGALTLWKRLMDERMSPALNRHELLYQEMAAANGGKVFTGAAVPVALTFDDYPRDFRDRMKPLLEARGLPCTIGLSSKMYDSTSTVIYAGAEGTTWAEIDGWPSTITIANHSATHGSAEDRLSMRREIVDGLRDLRAALPSKKIYTLMQPSVTYDAGFNNGDTLESYANTIAGHMQLGHHGYVTGTRRMADMATSCPMVGNRPIQGLTRNWLDTKSGIDLAQSRITSARAKKHGLILAAHADRFDKTGQATMAEITAFFDWLKTEQDAGRVKVLTLEQFAIAQYGAPAPVVDNAVGRTVKLWDTLNQRDQLIYGDTGQRDVSASIAAGYTNTAGTAILRRNGNIVTLTINSLGRSEVGTGNVTVLTLPSGFRPEANRYDWTFRDLRCAALTSGVVYITAPSTPVDYLSFTFATNDDWPTSLPGSAIGTIPFK